MTPETINLLFLISARVCIISTFFMIFCIIGGILLSILNRILFSKLMVLLIIITILSVIVVVITSNYVTNFSDINLYETIFPFLK